MKKRRRDYTGIEKECKHCHKKYVDVPRRRLFYCSIVCWRKSTRLVCVCKNCKKEYETTKTRNTIFCKKSCEILFKTGKKRPNVGEAISKAKLKGREPTNTRAVRKLSRYYKFREIVFNRDKKRCQICDGNGTDVHHIIEMAKDKTKWFDVDNGITLCKWCHDNLVSKRETEWQSYFYFNLNNR